MSHSGDVNQDEGTKLRFELLHTNIKPPKSGHSPFTPNCKNKLRSKKRGEKTTGGEGRGGEKRGGKKGEGWDQRGEEKLRRD